MEKSVYILYKDYWWELVKKKNGRKSTFRCLNVMGAGFDLVEKQLASILKKYKVCIAEGMSNLDWSGTCVYDNEKYKTGWLDRQGNFYGCDYQHHSAQAEYVHKSSERQLELAGWVKLTYMFGNRGEPTILYDPDFKPNKKQLDYIAGTEFSKDDTFRYLMEYHY